MTNPAYRILITKMAAELDQCHRLLMDDRRQRHPLADYARALLAEPDGPAVPEGREPASVTGELSDADVLRVAAHALGYLSTPPWDFEPVPMSADDVLTIARAVLARWGRPAATPVPVSERLPEPNTKVLAHYFNALGKGRTICAIWVPAKSRSDDADFADDDFTEYDEEDDKFYWPEGWYEAIENWEDLGWVRVYEGEVVYWQPLPKWPALPLPAPEGGEVS